MRISRIFFSVIAIVLTLTHCSNPEGNIISEVDTWSGVIPKIDLTQIPNEVLELNLSELISGIEFIPLETRKECLIDESWAKITNQDILISTRNRQGPAHIYRFDQTGKFLNEIGRGGKGPGEHTGWVVIRINELMDKSIMVQWDGSNDNPQRFSPQGEYMHEIQVPFEHDKNCSALSDSVWFSLGKFGGKPFSYSDSVAVIFYNPDGTILRSIPRIKYPNLNDRQIVLSGGARNVYQYGEAWRIYMSGNDTVFNIVNMHLEPGIVFEQGIEALQPNTGITFQEAIGKFSIGIFAESENNLFIKKGTIKTLDAIEVAPGKLSFSGDRENQFLIIDKKSWKARLVTINDDLLGMFSHEFLTLRLRWQGGDVFSATMPIFSLQKSIEENRESIEKSPYGSELLELMKTLSINSNPVIIKFNLKDRVRIN